MQRIEGFLQGHPVGTQKGKAKPEAESLKKMLAEIKTKFEDAMDDDFNTALALGHIFELIREVNRFLDTGPALEEFGTLIKEALNSIKTLGNVLNIFGRTPKEWNKSLLITKKIGLTEEEIERLIEERKQARLEKNYPKADSIRKSLEEKNIILEDKKDMTTWKVKVGG